MVFDIRKFLTNDAKLLTMGQISSPLPHDMEHSSWESHISMQMP